MGHFDTCGNHGFHIGFDNGYTISVQFGPGNYCEQYDASFDAPKSSYFWKSKDAEVAVLDGAGDFVTGKILDEMKSDLPRDDVMEIAASVSPDEVAKMIAIISALPKQEV